MPYESGIENIRVLPFSATRFDGKTIVDYQKEMDCDEFGYRRNFHAPQGTLLLYRCQNYFFGCAIIEEVSAANGQEYTYRIKVKSESYIIFNPIHNQVFADISPDFNKRSQTVAIIDITCKKKILSLIYQASFIYEMEKDIAPTEYTQVVKSRIGQSAFRDRLMKKYCGCMVCGLTLERQ